LKVLKPVETKGLTVADVDSTINQTHDRMVETLKEISLPPANNTSNKEL